MVLVDSPGVPRVPGYSGAGRASATFAYGAITRYGLPFQVVLLAARVPCSGPTTPQGPKTRRFRLFPFRSPLLRESLLLSLPAGTEMFQFPAFASTRLCIQRGITPHDGCWVSPFGHPRVIACWQLTEAFRSLPRPSSPPDAKAPTS